MSNLFATLTMFFVISLPTRSWKIPGRTRPTNNIAFFCLLLLSFAFAYHRADFGLVLSAAIQSLSQRAELMRKYFHAFFHHSATATNEMKLFYAIASIYCGWCLRRTRPVKASPPKSGKLRPSPKLDSIQNA